jgi:hypothetical protein
LDSDLIVYPQFSCGNGQPFCERWIPSINRLIIIAKEMA